MFQGVIDTVGFRGWRVLKGCSMPWCFVCIRDGMECCVLLPSLLLYILAAGDCSCLPLHLRVGKVLNFLIAVMM